MAKPEVEVLAPRTLYAGRRARVTIEITARKPTTCDAITARLYGEQGWVIGGGKQTISRKLRYPPEMHFALSGPTELPAGVITQFVIEADLPEGMAPSHELDPAHARCVLAIHISIPWRIDGRYRFLLPVSVAPPAIVERTPFAVRSNRADAAADRPRIEVSLASTRVIAGETLVGTVAVYHLDDEKPREVELSLVPLLTLNQTARDRDRRAAALTSTLTLPPGSAGTGVPFRLALPATMTPSFSSLTHDLTWWLVARTGSFFGGRVDVSVPLEIFDPVAAATTAKLSEAPRLGDERIATLFATFAAAHGWRGGDPDADADDPPAGQFSIERDVGDAVVRIAYDYRGEDGTYLVSRVEHPSLGLGLAVAPSSTMRHVFWKDIEVDIAAWDRAHHVTARSAAQTAPFLRAIVPTLMEAAPGTMRRWSDTELVFDKPMASLNADHLAELATDLERIAQAIAAADARIAPPEGVIVDREAWAALAQRCKGRLALGDLSITGRYEGVPVELVPVWTEGTITALRATYGDPELAPEALRSITVALARPALDVLGRDVAEALVEPLTRWPTDVVDLRIADGVASASLQLSAPVTLDAARARELVEMLRGALAALAPSTGPYR